MKRKMKIMGIALLVTVVLMTTVFATVGSRTAELVYNNIKILLNGKEVTPADAQGNAVEPFVIDGTTYLPVRAVANALGLNVGWDAETKTVVLDDPSVFSGAVPVYDDENVTIEFVGCRASGKNEWLNLYYADFNITNKTENTLTFQLVNALSFDGVSYQFADSQDVAPKSKGKVSFSTDAVLPTEGISKTSGQIKIVDMERLKTDYANYSYNAKWVDVVQE